MQALRIVAPLVATVLIISGILWIGSCESSTQDREPGSDSTAQSLPYSTRTAISRCDSMARAKLYRPDTMEIVSEPEAVDIKTSLSVARNIAAMDKYGTRYGYRYICTAMADGRGEWTGFSVELTPSN